MNVLAIVGSPRKEGNTHLITKEVLFHLNDSLFEKELLFIKDYNFSGCIGCNGCADTTSCVVQDDMQILYDKIHKCDCLILASPTYYYNVTSDMKKLIDRFFCLNIFDKKDRSVWTSLNHIRGKKPGIVISVCEQNNIDKSGFTLDAMAKPMEDIGFDIIYKVEVFNAFDKGEVLNNGVSLNDAKQCASAISKYFAQ